MIFNRVSNKNAPCRLGYSICVWIAVSKDSLLVTALPSQSEMGVKVGDLNFNRLMYADDAVLNASYVGSMLSNFVPYSSSCDVNICS